MEVAGGIFLVGRVGLIRPVDPDLLEGGKQLSVDQKVQNVGVILRIDGRAAR